MFNRQNAALGFIFVTVLIDVIGFGIIIPVVPRLLSEIMDLGLPEVAPMGAWLVSSFAIMQFLFSPIMGNLSDRYGRRPILLASLFGFGVDYLLVVFAPNITWFFIGRVVAGIMGASYTTAMAYVADITPPEKRAQNFGLLGAAFGLGFIIGPAIGGFVAQYGLRAPFVAAGVLTLLNWLYGFFILPESLKPENRRKFEWKRANPIGSLKFFMSHKLLLGLVGSIVLIYIAAHAIQTNWAYYTMEKFDWNEPMVGGSLAVVGLLVAIVQGYLIRLIVPRLGQDRSVYVGLMLYSVGFFLFAFATQGWMMYAILIPYCLGGIAGPSLQGIMSSQVSPSEQGELQGGLTSLISLTTIVGPPLMAGLFYVFARPDSEIFFPGAPMLMGCVLTIISAVLARVTLKKRVPEKEPVPSQA